MPEKTTHTTRVPADAPPRPAFGQRLFYLLVRVLRPLIPFLAKFPLVWRVRALFFRQPSAASWLARYGAAWGLPAETGKPGHGEQAGQSAPCIPLITLPPGMTGDELIGHLENAFPDSDFVVLCPASCDPHPDMAELFAAYTRDLPGLSLAYCDEWRFERNGSPTDVFCKPAWDPLLFHSSGYTGAAFLAATAILRPVAKQYGSSPLPQGAALFAECLARIAVPERAGVAHIPIPLFGAPLAEAPQSPPISLPQASPPVGPGADAALPRVSIIIPFRDRVDLLRPCVTSLVAHTDYPDLECILVDNGSTDAATVQFLDSLAESPKSGIRFLRLRADIPFNFSTLVNRGAAAATGDVLLLLNNDTEIRSASWLRAMVTLATRDDVGCVGAKLLYPNGLVQHGGIIGGLRSPMTGEYCFGHAHLGVPGDAPGYCGLLRHPRTVLAVTAAALAIRRDVFMDCGGFDEQLAVAFNDVDFCLRVSAAGLRTAWTPDAVLVHHESASRGLDAASAQKSERLRHEFDLIRERWGDRMLDDPWYNPNCSAENMYALAEPPRPRTIRVFPAFSRSTPVASEAPPAAPGGRHEP